jgi:hypothetical protein
MRITLGLITLLALGPMAARAQTRRIDFEGDAVERPPAGFSFGHTRKIGAPGRWVVQARDGARFLAQIDADRTNNRFPMAVIDGLVATNVDLSVRFKPVSGRRDKAAGLVWRYRDENNYYVVRANANEDNVVLYKVVDGVRRDLPVRGEGRTYGKRSDVPAGEWGSLRVVTNGSVFEVYHNGRKLYEVEDSTFIGPGKVGVWTKADSITWFDDLVVVVR